MNLDYAEISMDMNEYDLNIFGCMLVRFGSFWDSIGFVLDLLRSLTLLPAQQTTPAQITWLTQWFQSG